MFFLILLGAVITFVLGLAAKIVLGKKNSEYQITNKEFGISLGVMLVLVIPLTAWIGIKVAIHNQVTFNENWNGWETSVELVKESCYEDGPMRHYWIETRKEWVDEEYEDEKGNKKTKKVQKDVDYKIPYTTEEWTFVVHTTVGDVEIANRFLPENPNNYRYRWLKPVPSYPSTTGYPDFWRQVRERVNSNNPGPVSLRRTYDNYILASEKTILQRYNDSIDRYKKDNLFPAINGRIDGYYFADHVYFVGVRPPGNWSAAVQRFNAALGETLQGDLHLVIVSTDKVIDKDNYGGALTAYWQSEKEFGKDALSKNGIVIILGTADGGKTVSWAMAYTGMPMGNEKMLLELHNSLPGTPLDPQSLLGNPTATLVGGGGVRVNSTQGAIERILWGPNRFERVHMTDKHGGVGYEYLLRELEPTTGQQVFILVVVTLLAGIAWGFCIYAGPDVYREIAFRLGLGRRRF